MLFDKKVTAFVEKHFVPVLADHPMGRTEPKRNPDMWKRAEQWKHSPSNGQLVWLVSADESRRAGIYYSKVDMPEVLLGWMEAIAVFDGRIAKPSDAQIRDAVIVHLRAALRGIYPRLAGSDRALRRLGTRFDSLCASSSDDVLCGGKDAKAMIERLRRPSEKRKGKLRAELDRLLMAAAKVDLGKEDWVVPLIKTHNKDGLGDEAVHVALTAVLRSWLASRQ